MHSGTPRTPAPGTPRRVTPQARAAFSALHARAALHPAEERIVRTDMAELIRECRRETGIADIAALTQAGYGDGIAIDIGCDIAVAAGRRDASAIRAERRAA
ncbi:hypothetical protein [Oricola thermophila]|uniref:Uncharacterized protein n=1 Tax=Oricola thermophila TaxID=2742145 RepID=A0A6N1VGG1_9HYPH|nr:hypothetical protein [Oricola thermophila]QKV18745.1 hypothetical protein HTY61_09930 [Oricola thermophila]